VITLGRHNFAGPVLAPLWSPPRGAGLYAVMAPGWRLMTFRALEFDQSAAFSPSLLKQSSKYREWLTIVGTEWNLYIATCGMPGSSEGVRDAALRSLLREYRPEFKPMTAEN
jgi:hypothetical protein